MRCDACPVPAGYECWGERDHPPVCGYVAAGRREWIDHLVRKATGTTIPVAAQVRLSLARNTCPMGSKAEDCGCSDTRLCSRPDRPAVADRAMCFGCIAAEEWQGGVDPGW